MGKLMYVDTRPIFFPKGALKSYPNGLALSGKEKIEINATDNEETSLLKYKNGKNACFEKIRKQAIKEESE